MTFLGWLSNPFKGLSDLQLGDEKVTLNQLVLNRYLDVYIGFYHKNSLRESRKLFAGAAHGKEVLKKNKKTQILNLRNLLGKHTRPSPFHIGSDLKKEKCEVDFNFCFKKKKMIMKWWVEIILGEDYHILQNLQLAWLGFSKNHPKFWGTEKTNGFTLEVNHHVF